jgi:hypothetical protein
MKQNEKSGKKRKRKAFRNRKPFRRLTPLLTASLITWT